MSKRPATHRRTARRPHHPGACRAPPSPRPAPGRVAPVPRRDPRPAPGRPPHLLPRARAAEAVRRPRPAEEQGVHPPGDRRAGRGSAPLPRPPAQLRRDGRAVALPGRRRPPPRRDAGQRREPARPGPESTAEARPQGLRRPVRRSGATATRPDPHAAPPSRGARSPRDDAGPAPPRDAPPGRPSERPPPEFENPTGQVPDPKSGGTSVPALPPARHASGPLPDAHERSQSGAPLASGPRHASSSGSSWIGYVLDRKGCHR